MKSEREREAREFRATGEEEAQNPGRCRKNSHVIVAEAQRSAQELRGSGDS